MIYSLDLDTPPDLIKWIEDINYEIILGSKPIYSYYNDPSTPGFLRKNEIMIPVKIIASK